jgi:hypothetical protein
MDEDNDKSITLRGVPTDLLDRIRRQGVRGRRSANSEIIAALEEAFPEEELDPAYAGRKSSSIRYGDWTIWWEHKNPRIIKVCAPLPTAEQDGWWTIPDFMAELPGNGRPGSEGMWLTLRYGDPRDKNNWNRSVHAFEQSGQLAPPYMV